MRGLSFISGCFFLRSSERDPVFNGVALRSARFITFPEWTLFSALSFHVFWAGLAFSSPLFCHPIASGTSRKTLTIPVATHSTMKITNVVCSAHLNCTVDLISLCQRLRNRRYEPRSFPGLIWQHRNIGGNCLVFANGVINSNGKASSFREGR